MNRGNDLVCGGPAHRIEEMSLFLLRLGLFMMSPNTKVVRKQLTRLLLSNCFQVYKKYKYKCKLFIISHILVSEMKLGSVSCVNLLML